MGKFNSATIENPAAYEAAIHRNIIANAQKTWAKNTLRSGEIQNALNAGRDGQNYEESFIGSLAKAFDSYGKLSEKQSAAILKGIDARQAKKAEWASKDAELNAQREFLGVVGEKVTLTLTIKKVIVWDSNFGTQYLYILEDAQQNVVIYKGNAKVFYTDESGEYRKLGSTVTVIATVKEHGVRNEVKQTVIQRPKLSK